MQERRLSRAVRPEEDEYFPLLDLGVKTVECVRGPIRLRKVERLHSYLQCRSFRDVRRSGEVCKLFGLRESCDETGLNDVRAYLAGVVLTALLEFQTAVAQPLRPPVWLEVVRLWLVGSGALAVR